MTVIAPLKRFLLPTLIMLALSGTVAQPVAAQLPWGYSPITGSNSWLWLSRSIFSPSSLLFRGGYGYNAPYYLANTLAWNGAYAASQAVNYAGKKAQAKRYWSNPQNGINNPAVDQISVAPWYHPPRLPPGTTQPGNDFQPSLLPDPALPTQELEFMPVPQALDNSLPAGTAPASKETLPLTAPDFRAEKVPEQANSASITAENGPSSKSPFTQAFVDHINNNFHGDIASALKDKQTRAYAQALGVIEANSRPFDLPDDRIELIKRILNDPSEDSISKINAIRLLIKH